MSGLTLFKSGPYWHWDFDHRRLLFSGFVKPLPPVDESQLSRQVWTLAGGPLASILLAAGSGWDVWRHGDVHSWMGCFFLANVLLLLYNGVFGSDARSLLMHRKTPEAARWSLAAAQVLGQDMNGVPPRDWNARAFEIMLQMDPGTANYSQCQLFAYFRRMSQGNHDIALQHLEQSLGSSSACSSTVRQAVFLEAAFVNATVRRNAGNAQVWLKRALHLNQPTSTALVEAEIATLHGNHHRALHFYELARGYIIVRRLGTGIDRLQLERIARGERECQSRLGRR